MRESEFQIFINAGSIAACSTSANCFTVGDESSFILCSNTAASFLAMISSSANTPLT